MRTMGVKVVTEISSLVSRSVEQPRRSSAVPITCNRPIRKRVKNAERREMLESFVNRYRGMNLGKFPSPTSAQKEVGGSYYSIKKMLQEMEYVEKIKGHEPDGSQDDQRDDTQNTETENDEMLKQNPRDNSFSSEPKVEKQSDKIRNMTREMGEKDNELREKASLWGNLKSLVNEFINTWKK